MYFLLPAYADSHARLPEYFVWRAGVSPDEESGGAMPACRQAGASPVGLHKFCFASQKTYVNTLNELIYS